MNREQWKLHWREIRARKPIAPADMHAMVQALKEVYGYIYTDKQEVFIRLVSRYKSKLSSCYVDKIESWKPEAKRLADEMFKSIIYNRNPFLNMMDKPNSFGGIYIPLPIEFKNE